MHAVLNLDFNITSLLTARRVETKLSYDICLSVNESFALVITSNVT